MTRFNPDGSNSVRRLLPVHLEEGETRTASYACRAVLMPSVLRNAHCLSCAAPAARLTVSTRHVFLDVDDVNAPLFKHRLASVNASVHSSTHLDTCMSKSSAQPGWSVQLDCTSVCTMCASCTASPMQRSEQLELRWYIMLLQPASAYAVVDVIQQCQRLPAGSLLPPVAPAFDRASLVSPVSERVLHEVAASELIPLAYEPGVVALTNTSLYFQPHGSNALPRHAPLQAIFAAVSRQLCMHDVGIEVFFHLDKNSQANQWLQWAHSSVRTVGNEHRAYSALFSFQSERERDTVLDAMFNAVHQRCNSPDALRCACRLLEGKQPEITKLRSIWTNSTLLSNFDYLLLLNIASGRTFNDMSQWPVFPWVIQKFDSKQLELGNADFFRDLHRPIGALNDERLAEFWNRYRQLEEAQQEPFLYGTHYSSPAYVVHYLVRELPHHALKMQQGKFDEPDRLFNSISEAFQSALRATSDTKELIPSFFSGNGSFLVNNQGLHLGTRQDGHQVTDVELPWWASCASNFIQLHAEALESEYVSSNLHGWIDLVFGSKQQGEPALQANNVFHPLSYGHKAKQMLQNAENEQERRSMQAHIEEFGQCPRQLFSEDDPHPTRLQEVAVLAKKKHDENVVVAAPASRIGTAVSIAVQAMSYASGIS